MMTFVFLLLGVPRYGFITTLFLVVGRVVEQSLVGRLPPRDPRCEKLTPPPTVWVLAHVCRHTSSPPAYPLCHVDVVGPLAPAHADLEEEAKVNTKKGGSWRRSNVD